MTNPTVEALLILQERDSRVAHLTGELAHLPQQIAQVEADLATRTATFDELKSRTRQIEADRKKLDLDVQSKRPLQDPAAADPQERGVRLPQP